MPGLTKNILKKFREATLVIPARGSGASAVPARWWCESFFATVLFHGVIVGTFFVVFKHFVGFGNFLEAFFTVALYGEVRVVFPRQFAVRCLDRFGVSIFRYSKYLLVIFEFHIARLAC